MSLGLKRNTTELIDHDVEWEKIAAQTIQRLWKIFGSMAIDIQHIGSTSIKNIKAKPIIDIAVAIADFEVLKPLIPELEENNFSYRGWFIVERIAVLNVYEQLKTGDRITTHHIHIVKADSSEWQNHINFRDYLNVHPSVAKAYEAIKVELAAKHPYDEDRKTYNDGKNAFITQTINDAALWLHQL
ncbi:GrpB family protein [Candidatus Enterococcus ferrettii]|uniref:GrpB family protein n=1 Tax=Candidatus Enterococcus ferrettii TaxID=2815324 RepID=A0ABV0EQM9_9ENTE|nr:GrpB family protein [Enterococcus sp. 665A]MBO1339670.1 GrpB family protein [Enterococcus sp. 665A]